MTATFSETVTGITSGDFAVVNGTASNFQAVSGTVYTIDVAPTAASAGNLTVDMATAAGIDVAGNASVAATQLVQAYDTQAPTVVLTSSATGTTNALFTVTATFSETVTGIASGDFTVANGSKSNFVAVSGTVYTIDVTPTASSTGNVTVDVVGAAGADAAANDSVAATQLVQAYDTQAPTVVLTSSATGTTNALFTVTATFSETVTGIAIGDFTVANGTKSNFVAVSGTVYTVDVTPTASSTGNVTVDVAGAAGADAVGNASTAATQLVQAYDTQAPTVVLTSSAVGTTNALFTVTATFNETVTGIAIGDFTVANGTKSNFVAVSGTVYTVDVTPTASSTGNVTVDVAGAAGIDVAGNTTVAATQLVQAYDTLAPTVILTSSATGTTNALFTVTATFSESVTGIAIGDFTVANGTKSNFVAVSGTVYTVDVTPTAASTGNVTVDVAGAAGVDVDGNDTVAATQLAQAYDTQAPTVVLTSSATGTTNALFTVTATFSETVTGIAIGDLTVVNGTKSNFVAVSGTVYTVDVTPTASSTGNVTVDATAAAGADVAGNTSSAATQLVQAYDTQAPTVVLTSSATGTTNALFTVTATFSETVTGITIGDLTVANGTKSNFVAVSGTEYTVDVTPMASSAGNVTVDVAGVVGADAVGNATLAATQLVQAYDTQAPTVALSSGVSGTTNALFTLTATFSESVTGVALGDFIVANGTASDLTGSGSTYNVTITPTGSVAVTVTVDVPVNAASDTAGNLSVASNQFSITFDPTVPGNPIVTVVPSGATSNNLPVWSWTSGGNGGNGTFRYSLDDPAPTSWTTGGSPFIPGSALADGVHTLYVQERNNAGTFSGSGNASVTIDTIAPAAPVVSVSSTTTGFLPNWTWNAVPGATQYRYSVDSSVFPGTSIITTATSFAPSTNLSVGSHTLFVQAGDAADNWSAAGSATTNVVAPDTSVTVTLGALSATYNGTPAAATVSTSPVVTTSVTYVSGSYPSSSTPPTLAGSYTVTATVTQSGFSGSSTGTLVIAPAPLSVTAADASRTFGAANPTFTGTLTGVASTDSITATYSSSANGTTAIGVYGPASPQAIIPTLVDPGSKLANYTVTSTNGTLTITAGSATVALSGLSQTYNGTPRPVTVTTTPSGLTTSVTYNGSATVPTLAGSYPVVATITSGSFSGAANGTLVIAPAALTVTANDATRAIGAANPTFSGAISGLATGDVITATYASSATATTPIGVYGPTSAEAITPTLVDPGAKLSNYTVSTTKGTLTITPVTATVTMASQSLIYNGKPRPLTAVTVPAGLATTITYDGSTEVPVKLGTYTAVATITAPGYVSTPATATLTIRLAPGQDYPTSGGDSCGTGSGVAVLLLGAFLALSGWFRPRRR